jgi:hypothetical protein
MLFCVSAPGAVRAQSTDTKRPQESAGPQLLEDLPDVPYGPGRPFRQACQADYQEYCAGGEYPPLPFEAACLRQSWASLSTRCQQALEQRANAASGEQDNGAQQ